MRPTSLLASFVDLIRAVFARPEAGPIEVWPIDPDRQTHRRLVVWEDPTPTSGASQ